MTATILSPDPKRNAAGRTNIFRGGFCGARATGEDANLSPWED